MIVWLAIGVLYVLALTLVFFVHVTLDHVAELQAQLEHLTNVHNHNTRELIHRSEQTQVVKAVEL